MDPRIGNLPPLQGPRSVTQRRNRRQSGREGRAFDEALAAEPDDEGAQSASEAELEAPAPRALQNGTGIFRRQDDDGMSHVDVLA